MKFFFEETIFDVILIDEKNVVVLINFIVDTITIVTISLIKLIVSIIIHILLSFKKFLTKL